MNTVTVRAATPLLSVFLVACTSPQIRQSQADYDAAQAAVVKAYAKQAEANLLELELGDDGKLKRLVVGRQLGSPPQVTRPADPNVQMVREVVGGAVQVGGVLAGGKAAKGLVEAAGGAIAEALHSMPAPVVVEQPAPVQIPGAPPPEVVVVPPPDVVIVPPADPVIIPPPGAQ